MRQQQQQNGNSDGTSPWNVDDRTHAEDDRHSNRCDDENNVDADDGNDDDDAKDQDGGSGRCPRVETSILHTMAPQPMCNPLPPKQQPQPLQLTDCVICFDEPVTAALLPCWHRNCYQECAARLKTCHMCRATIVKVFPLLRHHRRCDDAFFSNYNVYRYRAGRPSRDERSFRPAPCLDDGEDEDVDNDAGENSDNENNHNNATVDCTSNS